MGRITIAERNGAIVELSIGPAPAGATHIDTPLLCTAARQLTQYLNGARREFDLPLAYHGTKFQVEVWRELLAIGFGKTKSYRDIAISVGRPKSCRAVGNAVGKNPIPIIIPCHRVISSDGRIGGFSLGLDYKRKLLKVENITIINNG